jgi:hypothetical protein
MSSNRRTATVQFVEDEDIYIDCRPVTTYGDEVVYTDQDNNVVSKGVSADMIDSIAINFSNGNITKNTNVNNFINNK